MRFGLTDAQLIEITAILQKYPEVSRSLIFGSRAMGNYGIASDIDLAVKGKGITLSTIASISGDLDDSELPLLCDVVNYHTIDHPPFKEHIDTEGVTFYRRGWQEMRLGDCITMNNSTYSSKEKWNFINYLDTSSIVDNHISEIQRLVVGRDVIPSRARRKATSNDLVYSTVRPNQRHFGFLKSVPENFLVSTGFAVIRGVYFYLIY